MTEPTAPSNENAVTVDGGYPSDLAALGIRVERGVEGIHYELPQRKLGKVRKAGIGFLIFGMVVTAFMIFWMCGPILGGLASRGPGRWISITFGLLGLPGLAFGLGIILVGIAILKNIGHSEILVTADEICSIECLGPIRLRFRRNLALINRLVVAPPVRLNPNNTPKQEYEEYLSGLTVECKSGKPIFVAPGYPREMVHCLADHLTASMAQCSRHAGLPVVEEETIPVVDESTDGPAEDLPVQKPADSNAVVRDLPNGFAIVVPPAGLFKGTKGMFAFSLLWNGFMMVMTTLVVSSQFGGSANKPPLFIFLVIGLFWAIGIGLLLAAINMGRRQTMLAVIGNVFAVKTTGIFGVKEKKVRIEEIGDVRVGPSGVEVNERPVLELQVLGKDDKKSIGLLSERNDDELRWMAWLIRNRTSLRKRRPTPPA
jgi:hypothetical protein